MLFRSVRYVPTFYIKRTKKTKGGEREREKRREWLSSSSLLLPSLRAQTLCQPACLLLLPLCIYITLLPFISPPPSTAMMHLPLLHIHLHAHTHIHKRHVHSYGQTHSYITHTDTHTSISAETQRSHTRTCVCIYAYTHIHTHMHISIYVTHIRYTSSLPVHTRAHYLRARARSPLLALANRCV